MFWVISVYFNIRNTLPKSGTFLLGHPVYQLNVRILSNLTKPHVRKPALFFTINNVTLYIQGWRPNLSDGEHDFHSRNITCSGHVRYKCRSVDTHYRSYFITVTVFISTNIIWFIRTLPAKNKFRYVWHCRLYHHRHFVNIQIDPVTSLALMEASHQIPTDPREGWLPDHLLSHRTDVLSFVKHVLVCRDQSDKSRQ